MAEENHTQMLMQQQPTSQQQQHQQQQQQQAQSQMQQSQIQQSQMQQQQQPQIQQPQMQQQSQMQQPQMQQSPMQQPQIQQQMQQQQQPQQQAGAVTMSLGSNQTVDQTNQMSVTTTVPINVATINVSQPQQVQTLQQSVNTSSGTAVQLTVPQLTAQAQTVQAGSMISQSSGPHPTMIHPTMTMAQSPLQQVQVIQQPLSATPYLQHVYTPQQQMVFPGNLTLQHTGMTTSTLQSIGATQGLSLQLQAKPALDQKNPNAGQTLQAVNTTNKNIVNTGTMMTASGQVIGTTTQKANFPQQMMAGPGKSTIIHSQSGFAPSNPNQTVVIGPVGVLPNQQQIFNHKALVDSQKGKTYAFHNQPQTLQPKSLYSSTVPVHSSAQVFNGSHLKQITSQPQIITSQAPGTMFSQAQIFGSFAPLPQGLSWATPGNFQSSTLLTQNPIILRSQQSDMYIQSPPQTAMHLPVAAASAPVPATTYAATAMVPQKHKQVRPGTQTVAVATQTVVSNSLTINSNTPAIRTQIRPKGKVSLNPLHHPNAALSVSAPQMATTQTQTNQSASQIQPHPQPQLAPQPVSHPKSDAANQTLPNQAKSSSAPEIKSPTMHSKSVGVEAKQLSPHMPIRSQAMVAPSTKVVQTTISPTIGVSLATVTVSPITTTVSSTPVVSSAVVQETPSTAPVMTSAKTSTSPPPPPSAPQSNLLENVSISDSDIADCVSMPETPKESAVKQHQANSKKAVESEPVAPQPILKPPIVGPVKEKQPQKAIVKPQVLTHVIDGFVIQEGPEPFPVSRSSLLSDPSYRVMPPEKPKRSEEYPAASPKKKLKIHSSRGNKELANCEFCGILGEKSKFKRSKRFCSISCAKGRSSRRGKLPPEDEESMAAGRKRKVGLRGRKGQRKQGKNDILDDNAQDIDDPMASMEESLPEEKMVEDSAESAPETLSTDTHNPEKVEAMESEKPEMNHTQKLPTKWSVQDVFEFIKDLPGCSDYADVFRSQEIDGQALLLLKEDHLMTAMCMKLGPALKLISHINSIKEELSLHT